MTYVCHLFDASAGWEQHVSASQLLNRLPGDRYECFLAAIGSAAATSFPRLTRSVNVFPCIPGLDVMTAPWLARFIARQGVELVHAWGPKAAFAAKLAKSAGVPLVIELHDPRLAVREIRLLRSIAASKCFAVVCSCETVRRRLIEGGMAPGLCVVIRPGVDFSLINRSRNRPLREQIGLRPEDFVVIVPEPATRAGGQFDAFWAVKFLSLQTDRAKIIVPGESRERHRICRSAAGLPGPDMLVTPGREYLFPELVANADVLVVAAQGDISTTSIAWAMAANVAVIGSAVYAVAELIANKLNGLLFRRTPDESPALPVARLLRNREAQDKAKEAARGQAYEVFGLRRYIEQHMRLYDNVMSGAPPGEGIVDSAMTG